MYESGTFQLSRGFHPRVDAAAYTVGIAFLRG